MDYTTIKNIEPSKICFHAEGLEISRDKLCIAFKEAVMDLEKIKELEFKIKGKSYIFKKQ